ncbi:RBBP9/YdeN family alpha/beta hydrolase [Novosphingobium panipatense]|uniref:Esterase n=1 Tax=Novosphingobium panipatense TaxID=428991 RepID=A0ABY1QQG9_9SPHN|nr:alpha/beta hydrolase [Novosphingobium panipatense]SMP78120.1 hypothetical protein SAMN06296065_11094 [Novosphingobium panipatense]
MATLRASRDDTTPLILLVPGTPLSSGHWMNRWAQLSEHCQLVELGLWDEPHRNTWVNKLNLAIHRAGRPVVVVTDDIAALALAWWVEYEEQADDGTVLGALIVDAPNVDLPGADPRLAAFGACPRQPLPFTSFLVGDLDGGAQRSMLRLARDWGTCPIADEPRGEWSEGWILLQSIVGASHGELAEPQWAHRPSNDDHRRRAAF